MSLRDLWDATKCTNICTMRGKKERKGQKIYEEIMPQNIPNFMKDVVNLYIQDAQKFSRTINCKRATLRHFISKLSKVKVREHLENSQREATCYGQGILNKIKNKFLIKNDEGQKAVVR